MRGVSDLIKRHEKRLIKGRRDPEFISLHRAQISFLQHERLAHLIVMLFTGVQFYLSKKWVYYED